MALVQHDVIIKRPIKDVFDFVNTFASYPRWQRGVVEAKQVSSGPLGVGSKIVEERRFLGRVMSTSWQVTDFRSPSARGFEITDGPLLSKGLMTLEPIAEGTRLNMSINMQGRGVFKLLEPLLVRMIQANNRTTFATLKHILESEG